MLRLRFSSLVLLVSILMLVPLTFADDSTPNMAPPPSPANDGATSGWLGAVVRRVAVAPATSPAPAAGDVSAPAPVPADATAAPAPAPAAPDGPISLKDSVENFWHYGKVNRYDLATAEGEKIAASGATPVEVLEAFEQMLAKQEDIVGRSKDDLDSWMLRWSNLDQMKDITGKVQALIYEGRLTRKSNPDFIKQQIERLSINQRAYSSAMNLLRQSGDLAVPFMLDYLHDPKQIQHHSAIRKGLRDLGKYGLNALVAATYSTDSDTLINVLGVLGDIHYDAAVPYIARLATAADLPASVHDAAGKALMSLGEGAAPSVADSFYALADKQFYGATSIAADTRNPMAFVWYWNTAKGLYKIDVPHPIFNDIMTMRQTEASLKAGASQGNALSLWLSANYKRQTSLAEDQKDGTRPENYPDANYWGVTAGAQYLNESLARALRDRDATVALSVIHSLQQIAGQSNMLTGGDPLIAAMGYPDRLVRFEAAFAIAAALPQRAFTGQERVVPLLAEAISQTGQASAVVAAPSQDAANTLVEGLRSGGMSAVAAISAEAAVAAANNMASVDVIIVSDDMPAAEVDKLFALASTNPKVLGAARLVMVKTGASAYVQRAVSDPMLSVTQASDAAGVQAAIPEALKKAGSLTLNPGVATTYAIRSGELLKKLAISRGQVMDIMAAKITLLNSLNDTRPEIVKLAGQVLGLMNDKDAQGSLLAKASEDQTADDVKISLYNSLATSAKFFGNQLEGDSIGKLNKTVESAQNLEVRSAAAESRGALNLPADQAKSLVIGQSKN